MVIPTAPASNPLFPRLLNDLASQYAERRSRAELLLAEFPSNMVVPSLLPLLELDPWDESASAAARLLLMHNDERVIPALHAFFRQRHGGIAEYVDHLRQREIEHRVDTEQTSSSGKVVSLFAARRQRR